MPVEDAVTGRVYFLIDELTMDAVQRQEDMSAIREGIADMEAGRVVPLDEVDARVRASLGLPELFAEVDRHADEHGVTPEAFGAAIDEAVRHVRSQPEE